MIIMHIFILFLLSVSGVVFGDNSVHLKNQQPNWKLTVVETYSNGAPLRVEFSAPIPKSQEMEKVKEKLFTPSGMIARESDLKNGVLHGTTIVYYPSEKIETIALYSEGKLTGSYRTFDEQGVLRDIYTYRNNLLDGPYELFSEKGILFEKGRYLKGQKTGEVTSFAETGELIKRENYVTGLLEGELTEYYLNGNPSAIWNYYRGLLHGNQQTIASIKYSLTRKVVEEQDFRMGQPWGWHRKYKEGVLVSEENIKTISPVDISLLTPPIVEKTPEEPVVLAEAPKQLEKNGKFETFYEGGIKRSLIEYKDGALHGKKILWDREGELLEEAFFVDGNLEGRYRYRDMDGSERLSHYKNNQLHGLFETTHPPHDFFGKIKALECRYDEGILEGDLIEYNIAGTKIAQIPHQQGLKEGKALYFSDKGVLFRTVVFEKDRLHGRVEEFYPNGAVKSEVLYQNGHKEGKETHYFDHGAVRSVTHYKNGAMDGPSKEWNKAGQLIYEGNFIAGERKGVFRRYDANGNVIKEKTYER